MSEKKRRRLESTSILSLPDDLLLTCIARVSRVYHRTLSLVSKRFRSLLASPDLYKMRSRESCLYVCFGSSRGSRWFTLWFTLSRNSDNRYVLTRVSTPTSHRACFSNFVAVGSDIYNIADLGSKFSHQSSRVSILDCRSHTWRLGPSFPVELTSFTACVVDRKIYVAGIYEDANGGISDSDCSDKLVKVLDIETQTWDDVPIPCCNYFVESACIDGKFHLVTDEELVAYDSKEGCWSTVERGCAFLNSDSYCGIGNVLYSCRNGWLRWYDTKVTRWRELKGLVGLPKMPTLQSAATFESAACGVRLADYGGKLAVLWVVGRPNNWFLSKKMIWCAVIKLERRTDCEIWGEVEWCDCVLDVPRSSSWTSWKALAATL